MKFLIINTDYGAFLRWLYAQHPGLEQQPYEEQMRVRVESLFGVADFYSSNLRKLGHEAYGIYSLPFRNKCFDFVYCCHVLEHTDNPLKACAEIMRVGKRGYIETPTMGKDALFMSAGDVHKWHVVAIGRNLCFFEYSQRQANGIRSTAWQDLILSKWYHPLQKAFYNNQDFFNVMFTWCDSFDVFVFHLDSTVESSYGGLAQKQI